jgi:hypothetical protein
MAFVGAPPGLGESSKNQQPSTREAPNFNIQKGGVIVDISNERLLSPTLPSNCVGREGEDARANATINLSVGSSHVEAE